MRRIGQRVVAAVMAAACGFGVRSAAAETPRPTDPVVFAYFKEPGNQGIYLALSRDGYSYTPLNDGQPWLKPEQPGELMRDVFVTRNPSGEGFRMVWTWSWHGDALGVSSSPDLLHWAPQQRIEVMHDFPAVENTWAPETYWDATRQQWLILWSSSFKPTAGSPAESDGLRLWATYTGDWKSYSKPQKFFDPGYPVIDATLFHRELRGKRDVVMVFKDQTKDPLRYDEEWVSGPTVHGPWSSPSAPIDESWSEGPSVLQVGDKAIVFYDHYRQPRARYEAVATTDWVHWTDATPSIHLPEGCKHGSFFRVTEAEAERLLQRHDAPAASQAGAAQ